MLCVRDEGTAIAPGESERLFQRFYRGPGAAQMSSGAGLGITIARGLATAQGGTLDLEVSELSLNPSEIVDAGCESAASGGIRRRTARVTPAVAPNPAWRERFRASAPRDTTDSG